MAPCSYNRVCGGGGGHNSLVKSHGVLVVCSMSHSVCQPTSYVRLLRLLMLLVLLMCLQVVNVVRPQGAGAHASR